MMINGKLYVKLSSSFGILMNSLQRAMNIIYTILREKKATEQDEWMNMERHNEKKRKKLNLLIEVDWSGRNDSKSTEFNEED